MFKSRHKKIPLIDQILGPAATKAEKYLCVGGAVGAMLVCYVYWKWIGMSWSVLQHGIAVSLVFDLAGGALVTTAVNAKLWWHRKERVFHHHFAFVASHGIHLALVTIFFKHGDWTYFGWLYGVLTVGAFIILHMPVYLRRPIAVGFYIVILGLSLTLLRGTPFDPAIRGMEWFLPLLFLKLWVGYLVPEIAPAPIQKSKTR